MHYFKIPTILLILTLSACVGSSVNNKFEPSPVSTSSIKVLPQLIVSDLEGKEYQLPQDLPSNYNIIVFGFAHEQKAAVSAWITPISEELKDRPNYSLFRMPVIDSSNAALRTIIRNGMRRGITESLARQRTLTMFGDKVGFTNALQIKDSSQVALALFNKQGQVLWEEFGEINAQKMDSLKLKIKSLQATSEGVK